MRGFPAASGVKTFPFCVVDNALLNEKVDRNQDEEMQVAFHIRDV